ncbi:MAG: hypothetical protein RIB53_14795 [Roseitalea porphyridii]|uniref:hypothetical protein n=1 Tax=Roseitalea porphyridii TaxID=1852022 RepID=UPI0032EB24F7
MITIQIKIARLLCIAGAVMALATGAVLAQDIRAGSRITISSEWHDANGGPYSPQVVSCGSDSGLCVRDTRLSPPEQPMTRTGSGLQVAFRDAGVIYLFESGGAGRFYNLQGEPVGVFRWSQ